MSNERNAVLLAGEIHEELRKCRARVAELERERDEAAAEAAACVEFLRTLRAEGRQP